MQQLQQVFGLYSSGQFNEALWQLPRELERKSFQIHPVLLNLLGAVHAALTDYDAAICRKVRKGDRA